MGMRRFVVFFFFFSFLISFSDPVYAEGPCNDPTKVVSPLGCVPRPQPTHAVYLHPRSAAMLGKALFWDVQVGSDNQVACATCHFHAGVDSRKKNVLNPGPDNVFSSGGVHGPGQDFNLSSITSDDRVGSQGVPFARFLGLQNGNEVCVAEPSPIFGGQRQVTGRNAPPVINAVFNVFNFWDGRANPVFNGVDPFGNTANSPMRQELSANASLASQAVGPVTNDVEMSCAGRPFNGPQGVGAKLWNRPVLQFQKVSPNDSLLGQYSAFPQNGLKCGKRPCTYGQLIAMAYGPSGNVGQFSLIFGEAVQAYESLLVSDRTPFDAFVWGARTALTRNQIKGLDVFLGKGRCTECHTGPELSDATFTAIADDGVTNEDGGDQGFHNIGVRPTHEDLGRASVGPGNVSFEMFPSLFNRGAFKTPQLRNVKLTAPYFHNGGKATLEDLVDFYNRGGDFRDNPELARDLRPLSLNAEQKTALVDFLRNGLTDCRVEREKAPFDHPSLALPNGDRLSAVGRGGVGPACNNFNIRAWN